MSSRSARTALVVGDVRSAVGDRWPQIDVVDETTSTNAEMLATAHERGDREVLVAEQQTSGRGRLDRAWTSPPRAGLLVSMLVRPGVPVAGWGWLPLLTGVALAEAVHEVSGVACALKWPNDLLIGEQQSKAAGILVQTVDDAVVIGIGLNVSTTADELPVPTATSLAIEGAQSVDRVALLVGVLSRLDQWLRAWQDEGGDAVRCGLATAYRQYCATLGSEVRVGMAGEAPIEGKAIDLDGSGRLVIEHSGRRVAVAAGDVEHVRPI